MDEYVRVFREHGVNITKEEVSIYFSSKVGTVLFILFMTSLHPQDKDRDGLISYQEFCGRKTVTEKAFEVRELEETQLWDYGTLLKPFLFF